MPWKQQATGWFLTWTLGSVVFFSVVDVAPGKGSQLLFITTALPVPVSMWLGALSLKLALNEHVGHSVVSHWREAAAFATAYFEHLRLIAAPF